MDGNQEHILCFRSDLSSHLSFHIKELGEKERPVKGHLQHVVPPNSRIFWQIRYWIYMQDMRKDIITKLVYSMYKIQCMCKDITQWMEGVVVPAVCSVPHPGSVPESSHTVRIENLIDLFIQHHQATPDYTRVHLNTPQYIWWHWKHQLHLNTPEHTWPHLTTWAVK